MRVHFSVMAKKKMGEGGGGGGGGGGQVLKGKLECKGPPSIMLLYYVGSPEEI